MATNLVLTMIIRFCVLMVMYMIYDDTPKAIQATQQQVNEIIAGCNNTTGSINKEFTNDTKRKYDGFFSPNQIQIQVQIPII